VAGTAVHGRLAWQVVTVTTVIVETPTVRTIRFDAPEWPGHLPGQHIDVRLTAEDGYQASREYSIASVPGEPLEITVQRLDDGEVSSFLTEELRVGDQLEIRGPVGGYFVWSSGSDPLMLVAGGSGIVPLRSMLRHRARTGSEVPARLLYSVRTPADIIYRDELDSYDGVTYTFTRQPPPGWTGHTGRVTPEMLSEVAWPADRNPIAYVCGPTMFVETAARELLLLLKYPMERIKTERFGGALRRLVPRPAAPWMSHRWCHTASDGTSMGEPTLRATGQAPGRAASVTPGKHPVRRSADLPRLIVTGA
jgi:ferredoxin-NADP reductase